MTDTDQFDVIVVGGGPAGSVLAWSLASQGVRTAVVERARFPREKVCGDFVEPGGLRILQAMGCLDDLGGEGRLPVDHSRVYFGPKLAYRGPIPYYETADGLPPHGYIIPRHELDTALLARAEQASAAVFQGCSVTGVRRQNGVMEVAVEEGERTFALRAPLVVGADGTESVVGRSAGLRATDRRHIGLSQRAYVEGAEIEGGEAAIWFDEDLYPGYGWIFPMGGGRANLGVGLLSESAHRYGLSTRDAFQASVERIRIRHPGCGKVRLASKPLGGVVKMYGGIGPNHFDGGLLIGDAGSFVDPMTGEGITQGMESALIASRTLVAALQAGRFDKAFLGQFERDFRAYFDPAMLYLDLCAAILRNRHFKEFWLRATQKGFEIAAREPEFGRVAGCAFGGLNVQPIAMLEQVWGNIFRHVIESGGQAVSDLLAGRLPRSSGIVGDLAAWERGWSASLKDDPQWHMSWLADLMRASLRLQKTLWTSDNPRTRGPLGAAPAQWVPQTQGVRHG